MLFRTYFGRLKVKFFASRETKISLSYACRRCGTSTFFIYLLPHQYHTLCRERLYKHAINGHKERPDSQGDKVTLGTTPHERSSMSAKKTSNDLITCHMQNRINIATTDKRTQVCTNICPEQGSKPRHNYIHNTLRSKVSRRHDRL